MRLACRAVVALWALARCGVAHMHCEKNETRRSKCATRSHFLVLSYARTGSSFLVKMLNSHREICARGELMHPDWGGACERADRDGACGDAVGAAAGGAVDAMFSGARDWAPAAAADAAAARALEQLRATWWRRFDGYRFCGTRKCCAIGFKWFPHTQGARTAAAGAALAAWAASTDVRFVVLHRRHLLAQVASLQRKNVDHEASKIYGGSTYGAIVGAAARAGAKPRSRARPRADVAYLGASCRGILRARAGLARVAAAVPRDRLRVVAYEDVVGDGADAVLADLVAFVGARDTAAKLTTDLVRNGNGTDGFFADDAAAAAALRAAGCPEVAPRLLPDGDQREP